MSGSRDWTAEREAAERSVDHKFGQLSTAIDQRMTERADLIAMCRQLANHLASVALLDVDVEVKRTALRMSEQARGLLRRIEGRG